MKIETSKITEIYSDLVGNPKDSKKVAELGKELSSVTGKKIEVHLATVKDQKSFFGMSVTPDKSTVDKIAQAIVNPETPLSTIKSLWASSKSWRLDIDTSLFEFLSPNELTAITLHEIGHIIDSDSAPERIQRVVQYTIASSSIGQKAIMAETPFTKIISIPIVAACQFSYDKDSIKKELKADQVAARNGYADDLVSAMSKIERHLKNSNLLNASPDADLVASTDYTVKMADQLSKRKSALTKNDLLSLKKHLPGNTYLYESVEDSYQSIFMESGDEREDYKRMTFIQDLVNHIVQESYYSELGGHKLKPIERNQIDYIRIKVSNIHTINDKLMIISYINGKIELAEYYVNILQDKKASKKYKVPHREEQLQAIIEELQRLKEVAMNKQIEDEIKYMAPIYPAGYEG
jgi:hypothetical protein